MMQQLTIDHRAQLHLHQFIANVTSDLRLSAKFDPSCGMHVPVDATMNHDMGNDDVSHDRPGRADHDSCFGVSHRFDIALNAPIHVQLMRKADAAKERRACSDQRHYIVRSVPT
jgi:hypothetical protein